MKVAWCFASGCTIDPTIDIEQVQKIGTTWGSWKTWRSCDTENVVCYDFKKAGELNKRALQAVTNLYMPQDFYSRLNRPSGIKYFEGTYLEELDEIEDIISIHLAAASKVSIVLLLGYSWEIPQNIDPVETHKIKNYYGMLRSAIANNPQIQFVAVEVQENQVDSAYTQLENFTCDSMQTVLQLL